MNEKDLINFAYSHEYSLNKVTETEKRFVLSAKGVGVNLSRFSDDVRRVLVLRSPVLFYESASLFEKYLNVYKIFKDLYTPPRGFIGDNVGVIIGIAPGYSKRSFGEPKWLYGPSSEILHTMLEFRWEWYFTNVCKEPFLNNEYDLNKVDRFYPFLIDELNFFKDNCKNVKLIFLGKYPIYEKIITTIGLPSLNIYHPSYLRRVPNLIPIEREKLVGF